MLDIVMAGLVPAIPIRVALLS